MTVGCFRHTKFMFVPICMHKCRNLKVATAQCWCMSRGSVAVDCVLSMYGDLHVDSLGYPRVITQAAPLTLSGV